MLYVGLEILARDTEFAWREPDMARDPRGACVGAAAGACSGEWAAVEQATVDSMER
jgi:hypothetical protein